ncbi:MAG: hypothetical protein RLZZ369_254 [Pseudomonadota bacterium]|jgi:lipase chaperone LimK|nr:hypothetical protein [Aquabacterium sp.]MBP8191162.1 hypothetical protein [Aquabacterium sp.]
MTSKILLKTTANKSRIAWALAAGVGALMTLVFTHGTGPADPSHAPSVIGSSNGNDLARTFMGTTPDGTLANQGKDLILSPELIRRFEYHLTAVGERTQAQIREAIVKDITTELNEKGQKEALRILDAYLKFKTALGSVDQPKMTEISGAALARHFRSIRDLRALYFQPSEVAALFGNVDEYDDYTAKKLAIVQNKSLSDADREAQLQYLKNTLSAESRANVEQPVVHLTLATKEEQARQQGATPAEIQQIRTNLVGADAAKRLEALDREEAAWKARIKQYQEARATSPESAQQLKHNLFTPQEQLRLAAYE